MSDLRQHSKSYSPVNVRLGAVASLRHPSRSDRIRPQVEIAIAADRSPADLAQVARLSGLPTMTRRRSAGASRRHFAILAAFLAISYARDAGAGPLDGFLSRHFPSPQEHI